MTVAGGDPGGTGLWLNLLWVSWMQRRACYVRACYVSGRGNGPLGSGMEWLIITCSWHVIAPSSRVKGNVPKSPNSDGASTGAVRFSEKRPKICA